MQLRQKNIHSSTITYGIATMVITFIITVSYYHLWGTDIHVPLTGYRSDSVGMLLEANNYIRGGNTRNNVIYAAPDLKNYRECIDDSRLPLPLIGVLSSIFGNVEAAINIHAILNIVLLALSMYCVCVQIGVRSIIALLAGICYSCIPMFVFWCNTVLLIYSLCFYIPVFCLLILNFMSADEVTDSRKSGLKLLIIIVDMLLVGICSAYYSFFALIILVFVAMYAFFRLGSVKNTMLAVMSIVCVVMGIASYVLPNIFYKLDKSSMKFIWDNGWWYILWTGAVLLVILLGAFLYKKAYPHITIKRMLYIAALFCVFAGIGYVMLKRYTGFIGEFEGRTLYAVELGALNPVNLILPTPNNLSAWFDRAVNTMVDLENQDFHGIGIIGGIGFIYSLLNVFRFRQNCDRKDELVKICGICNAFVAIVAVKGGLSSLIAKYLTTGIRGYNRIEIYIACFSLISFAIMLDKLLIHIKSMKNSVHRNCLYIGVCVIILLGLIISVPTSFIHGDSFGFVEYDQRKREYDDWHDLMSEIESRVPEESMIFELPTSIDGDYFGKLMDRGRAYELSIPAIISRKTIWSYGGGWQPETDMIENTEGFINEVRETGFAGIYVDTLLYNDNSYEEQLQALEKYLGQPIVCNENRRYFFTVDNINAEE